MFKKVAKKTVRKTRLRARSDDDESSSQSAMNAIQETRRKRKLLNEVQHKRGLDATLNATPSSAATSTSPSEPKQQEDLTERLKGTFSGGTGGDANSGEGGILQRKHKDAMEEFIRQNLKQSQEKETEAQEESSSTVKDMKAKLYAELASASLELAGTKEKQQDEEGDVGAGGAMLGGTGIAEVALPVDDRIQTIKETEQAISLIRQQGRVLNRNTLVQREVAASLPLTFSAGADKRGKTNLPMGESSSSVPQEALETGRVSSPAGYGSFKDDVSDVPLSYSHNFQLHKQEWVQQKKEGEQANVPVPVDKHAHVAANNERIGFEAARRVARGKDESAAMQSQEPRQETEKRSTDDRVWKSFMAKQHENRDRR